MAKATVIPTDSKRVIEVNNTCKSRQATVLYTLPFKIRITNITWAKTSPLSGKSKTKHCLLTLCL